MTCLLTGSTGFLGSIFATEFSHHFDLTTLGRSVENDLICDLAKEVPVLPQGYDWVVHNAGKAHMVPRTQAESEAFWELNHKGTLRLLEAIDNTGQYPRCFVFISTVAVYGVEEGMNISENHPLQGQTPYAKSKIAAEAAIQEWGTAHNVLVVILRLPLVTGPNPPGNLGKMEAAIRKGRYVRILGNTARKSRVAGVEVARLIPTLIGKSGVYNLTDGVHPTFCEIEEEVALQMGKKIRWGIPAFVIRWAAKVGDYIPGFPLNTAQYRKLTASLTFSDEKARKELGWGSDGAYDAI